MCTYPVCCFEVWCLYAWEAQALGPGSCCLSQVFSCDNLPRLKRRSLFVVTVKGFTNHFYLARVWQVVWMYHFQHSSLMIFHQEHPRTTISWSRHTPELSKLRFFKKSLFPTPISDLSFSRVFRVYNPTKKSKTTRPTTRNSSGSTSHQLESQHSFADVQGTVKDGLPFGPTVQKVEMVRRELGAFRFSTPRMKRTSTVNPLEKILHHSLHRTTEQIMTTTKTNIKYQQTPWTVWNILSNACNKKLFFVSANPLTQQS